MEDCVQFKKCSKNHDKNLFCLLQILLLNNLLLCKIRFCFTPHPPFLKKFSNINNMANQNTTQKSLEKQTKQSQHIITSTPFQSLNALPNSLWQSQCVLHKYEILICGGYKKRDCYSYHTLKNEYKFICEYPNDVALWGHCVVKLVDNNKNSNEITLLSFGGDYKHTLVMKYMSVWSNENDENESNKLKELNNHNQWIPFKDNDGNPIQIGRDYDNYWGVRAVIGGSNNHLLFIAFKDNNISVFDLNTFQFIKHSNIPTDDLTGLSIEYDEDDNTFQFCNLPVCKSIAVFSHYAYVCINDVILFFGGSNLDVVSKSVHKYSIRENKWMTFQNTLLSPLGDCVAILSEDNTYVHIIGESTHVKTQVSELLSEEEMKVEKIVNRDGKGQQNKLKKDDNVEHCFFSLRKLSTKKKRQRKETNKQARKDKKKEKNKKWMKWWNQREQRDKTEIIQKFKIMSSEQFRVWLLSECKWKRIITKDDIDFICFSIDFYLDFVIPNQGKGLLAYVIIDEIKKLIKMKELTFEELLRQSYNCLKLEHFQKMNNEYLKLQLVNMNDNVIESDKDVTKEFETNEPTFKITWIPFQQLIIIGKTKTIKNALVIMIAISEYMDKTLRNLPNVNEKDVTNFKQLFEEELKYDFICNPSPKMTKQDLQSFFAKLNANYDLHENTRKYDGLIVIICGHGEDGNVFVTSDGKQVSIDKIRSSYNCNEMESFKDLPKIFIIDCCRGENIPKSYELTMRGKEIYMDTRMMAF
ncbi:hypothetical protein RFI_05290 [Reticulomyxa filosa]|uniref:Caspase family p20 domain-containing protein n=1 Tax=Reticulomyxa filosa TaxID=46433 RepID=X6P0T0_RETFI|nr:hypothetical protein RFI_05290 [Reticulomyxa filosa]|eukprot:ETO31826.1 hypothetical protein RFI_05290 [Reticulomyxa filosa]